MTHGQHSPRPRGDRDDPGGDKKSKPRVQIHTHSKRRSSAPVTKRLS
ncbi:hypothetical protein APV28_1217 [Comamonas testosteroni]|nr:hypothetical protein APV28_1217 [Comamonas testosteroni]